MGETCSACHNKEISLEEIQINDEDNKPQTSNPDNKSKSHKSKQPSLPVDQVVQKEQSKELEESKKGERKKEISVMTSKFNQTRVYQRFGNNASKLDQMPDYSN